MARLSNRRTGASARGRRVVVGLAVLVVALLVIVELLLVRSYESTDRTTRDFRRTTDAMNSIANAQREAMLLSRTVTGLRDGDSTTKVMLRRGLLERQLDVVSAAAPDNRALGAQLQRIRADLRGFDAQFADTYGDGARARVRDGRRLGPQALRALERDIKRIFDGNEQALYQSLHDTLDENARDQLVVILLSVLSLLVAAALGFVIRRAIRGDFARAYDMLDRSQERFRQLVEQIPGIVYTLRLRDRKPQYVSPQAEAITGLSVDEWQQGLERLGAHVPATDLEQVDAALAQVAGGEPMPPMEFRFVKPGGEEIWLRDGGGVVTGGEDDRHLQGLLLDVTAAKRAEAERDAMELELRLAQKLEAVGQLAAGIAHEINTPIQFVGDTLAFLREGFGDLMELETLQAELLEAARNGTVPTELIERVGDAVEVADVEYLRERVPAAVERGVDGIDRVGTIVRAMREFGRPATTDKAPVDLNAAVRNTLVVTASEYRYIADVETDLHDLPAVECNGGEINQVLLNLIVNAAHAIDATTNERPSDERGTIRVGTRRDGTHVVVSVSDTGTGIPAAIADQVFDPFFTTKEVGHGTGQGLAISRTLVVERHGGSLSFETEPGQGTTFHMRLPV